MKAITGDCAGDPRALAQGQVGHVAVGRRPHGGPVEVPLGAVELGLQLLDLGLALLHVEGAPGVAALQLGELRQAQLGELELRLDRLDLRLDRWSDRCGTGRRLP